MIEPVQEITAVAANGAKAQFDRIPQGDNKKFRKLALDTAAQQNLASCIALLKEVAAHYGFALDIREGETRESLSACAAQMQRSGLKKA